MNGAPMVEADKGNITGPTLTKLKKISAVEWKSEEEGLGSEAMKVS